jgi:hypothetical protein
MRKERKGKGVLAQMSKLEVVPATRVEEPLEVLIQVKSVEEDYPVLFRADGTGCFDVDEYYQSEEFSHDLDLVALHNRFNNREELARYLEDYFWDKVNPTLEGYLLKDYSELDGKELEFVSGKPEEFDRLMRFFLLTEPELDQHAGEQVMIRCALEEEKARLEKDWDYYASDRLMKLVELALKEHQPYGYTYEYNEQAGDRRSGYSLTPASLIYELDEFLVASARERMNARRELREWLVARDQNPASFGLDNWEKIL